MTQSHPTDRVAAMRLRFSIRDLLWLTLAVALAVGWWLDRRLAAKIDGNERNTYHGPTTVSSGINPVQQQ
jgi:hypothetical protein